VIALAIPAAGDFRAVNVTTDAGLTFGWVGEPDAATKHRTIELVGCDITAPPNRRPLHVRYADSLIIRNTAINSALPAIFLEAAVDSIHIEDSNLTSCSIHPVIDGTSPLFPFEGCSIVVIDSTLRGRGFLTVSGMTPEIGLHGANCCNCNQICTVDVCDVEGGETVDCCEQMRDEISPYNIDEFTTCLNGPQVGILPGCHCLNLVADGDFDLQDFAALQILIAED
jgi:hypothetical protein